MIKVTQKGDFKHIDGFFKRAIELQYISQLEKYGEEGVRLLSEATPVDTGTTAASWRYEVEKKNGFYSIYFVNDNAPSGVKVAILLQYGHATKNGGWVEGIDYINPALKPLFEKLADNAWLEITRT